MKLTKISYISAVFFAALTFLSTLISGLVVASAPQVGAQMGIPAMTYLEALSITATQTVAVYIGLVFAIAIYNLVAKKYPISWEIAKK